MLTLYITRHGETVWNTQKRMQGWSDSELTENGIENAVALGDRLREVDFDAIYTSPSKRTLLTADLIKGKRDVPFFLEDNLREINMGEWEGQTFASIEDKYPMEFNSFWNTPHLYKSLNGESFNEVKKRVVKAVNSIEQVHRSGKVLIVTHSVVIKTLLAFFKNYPIEKLWEPPFIHGTSLTVVELNGEERKIVLEGDVTHKN
ncbi:histidine phosphatase family protein [Salipaludibacillus sp. CUR1]|uniref:histidine phosphatase family protein n=1 Tax=Salipaludibacillus sp. CUR1 TaxID=2820003 RepID=UPI001E2F7F03|nr:histidine phosphatase family protein [Salipaludibacillus sp. CUR1]MCE7793177.1 histidine phosphatase family protein [Salipaludibacillus sp. CUR1]